MNSFGWVAVGVTAWTALSVPAALLVGAVMRAGARAEIRLPAHVRHRVGCRTLARQ